MSKILFVNGNLHGHINPTLPVVAELVRLGEEVSYFSTKEFQTRIEATGAIFMDYGDEFNQFLLSFRPHGTHPFYTLMEYMLAMDLAVVPIVLKKTVGLTFDCILHDVMFGGGNIIAQQLQLPAIASCSSFVLEKPPLPARMLEPGFHPQLDYLYEEMKAAQQEWQLEDLQISDLFFKRADKILVYTSRLFQPLSENFDDSFKFVGPSIMDRKEILDFPIDTSSSHKLIYISLGTITNHYIEFYSKCIEAFKATNYQVIMSVGNKTEISSLPDIPDNFTVRTYIPQLEVLEHADLILSHGGLNSVSEALYYGVPVIVIPMSNDQPAVAKRITELGAGIELSMADLTSEQLYQTANTILSNQGFQLRSKEIGDTFRQAGGYQKAAEEIFNFIK